jgi:hypothetical protein
LPIIALGGGMRPIYQIDEKYRWVTDAVPSRWGFEANMLHETGIDGWKIDDDKKGRDNLPDMGDPDQVSHAPVAPPTPPSSPAPAPRSMEGVSHPPAVAMPKGVIPPGTIPAGAIPKGVLPGAPMPAPVRRPTPKPAAPATKPDIPEQRLKGDAAEVTIPHYLISWTDDKGDHTARAYEGEVKNINGNTYKAKNFRHDFQVSIEVLLGMLAALVLTVIGILLKRDSDPQ